MNSITLFVRCAAAALLLLGAGTAFAQADFTYQAVLDLSWGRFEPSGQVPDNRFNSNSLSASFVGGTAKYGFEDGWTAGLTLETFLRFQDFATGRRDSDPLLSRNAFAFVNGPYGAMRAGRLQTYLFDTTTRFNALGNSPAFSPAIRQIFGDGNLEGVQGDFYWDRAVSCTSPKLMGATLNLMTARGSDAHRGHYDGGNIVYSEGLLNLAISMQQVHVDNGIDDPTRERTWQLGATYNFGLARLFGLYTVTRDIGLGVHSKIASLGASAPLGPGTLEAQVGRATADGDAVRRRHLCTSAAYVYAYDSTSDLYAIAMDDRIRGQTRGVSAAVGVRLKF